MSSKTLVLDSEALSRLAGPKRDQQRVVHAIAVAKELDQAVTVPAVVLAELFRGTARVAGISDVLKREAIQVRNTDPSFAKTVGGVLHAARAESEDMVDAHCVAIAVDHGGGTIITSDVDDIERLTAGYRMSIAVKSV